MVWKLQRGLSGARVECADIARRRGQGFAHAAADDNQVFVNGRGAGQLDPIPGFASQAVAQIYLPAIRERFDRLTGFRVQRIEILVSAHENPLVLAVRPVSHAAVASLAADVGPEFLILVRIKAPEQFAGRSIERDHIHLGGGRIEHAIHHDGIAFNLRTVERIGGVESPGHLQLLDVVAIDLAEAGVVGVGGIAAGDRPVLMVRPASMKGSASQPPSQQGPRDQHKEDFCSIHGMFTITG